MHRLGRTPATAASLPPCLQRAKLLASAVLSPSARAEKQLSDPSQRIHKVLETARVLYGLIHARYILTAQGLSDMVRRPPVARIRPFLAQPFFARAPRLLAPDGTPPARRCPSPPDCRRRSLTVCSRAPLSRSQKAKFKACEFGACPRTLCEKQTVLPVGLSDSVSLSGDNPMKLFCPRCRELYDHNVPGGNYIDGAFFGSTFPHLFLQTYGELRPQRCTRQYIPRVFGFKVHQVSPRVEWRA